MPSVANLADFFFISYFFYETLYTGPEFGATGQSKTLSCQSGTLLIKKQNKNNSIYNWVVPFSIKVKWLQLSWSDHKIKHSYSQLRTCGIVSSHNRLNFWRFRNCEAWSSGWHVRQVGGSNLPPVGAL